MQNHAGAALLRHGRAVPVAVAGELAPRVMVREAPQIRRVDAMQLTRAHAVVNLPAEQTGSEAPVLNAQKIVVAKPITGLLNWIPLNM